MSSNEENIHDRGQSFFPKYKTTYIDDAPELNSLFTDIAIRKMNKIADVAWGEFFGTKNLTHDETLDYVRLPIEQMERMHRNMVESRKYTSVEVAEHLLATKKSWKMRDPNVKTRIKIGLNFTNDERYKKEYVDISNITSIIELSAYLRRADQNTYTMFDVANLARKTVFWTCVAWIKKAPGTWNLNVII